MTLYFVEFGRLPILESTSKIVSSGLPCFVPARQKSKFWIQKENWTTHSVSFGDHTTYATKLMQDLPALIAVETEAPMANAQQAIASSTSTGRTP